MTPSNFNGLPWLTDHAWPLWLEHGVDWRRRAFHENLDAASLQCAALHRRLRVVARQTYVFSKAARYDVPRAKAGVQHPTDARAADAERLRDLAGSKALRFHLAHAGSVNRGAPA